MSTAHLAKPRKPFHGAELTGLRKARYESGLTAKQLARKAGVSNGTVYELELRGLARNDPRLERIAAAYGVPLDVVLEACPEDKVMTEHAAAHLAARSKVRTVKKPATDTVPEGKRVTVSKKATAVARIVEDARTYDVARPIPKSIRNLMRALADSTNIAILKRKRYMDLKTMPTREFAEMLSDYMKAKGIDAHIVLTDDYGGHFSEK